jgi:hypothetical protein
MSLACKD